MTQPIHLIGSTYAVEVPEGATGFDINKYCNGSELNYWLIAGAKDTLIVTDLPPGNWEIICTTKKCGEEQSAGIVQIISNGKLTGRPQYRRYDRDPVKDTPARCWTRDPRHALETLLTSKSLDTNKNYVIIKKVS